MTTRTWHRRAGALAAALVTRVACTTTDASSAASAAGTHALVDGFVVTQGTTAIGPVFTQLAIANPAFAGQGGWTAGLDVTGAAGPVFDNYVDQARSPRTRRVLQRSVLPRAETR
jgi:hypothetical protein